MEPSCSFLTGEPNPNNSCHDPDSFGLKFLLFCFQKRLMNAAKKAITKMPLRTLRSGDRVSTDKLFLVDCPLPLVLLPVSVAEDSVLRRSRGYSPTDPFPCPHGTPSQGRLPTHHNTVCISGLDDILTLPPQHCLPETLSITALPANRSAFTLIRRVL